MRPTLNDKQFFFIFVDYYKDNEINYGDIVLFNVKDEELQYIKRIVGLPGDKIEMKKGILIVNDIPKTKNKEIEMNVYEENIDNFTSFKILNISKNDVEDNFKEIRIPKGYYFVLGDNRENSLDSRDIGLISKKDITDKFVPETHYVYYLSWYFFSISKIKNNLVLYSEKLYEIISNFSLENPFNKTLNQIKNIYLN